MKKVAVLMMMMVMVMMMLLLIIMLVSWNLSFIYSKTLKQFSQILLKMKYSVSRAVKFAVRILFQEIKCWILVK